MKGPTPRPSRRMKTQPKGQCQGAPHPEDLAQGSDEAGEKDPSFEGTESAHAARKGLRHCAPEVVPRHATCGQVPRGDGRMSSPSQADHGHVDPDLRLLVGWSGWSGCVQEVASSIRCRSRTADEAGPEGGPPTGGWSYFWS